MTAADEDRQEPRTAGSLSHADRGREVDVSHRRGVLTDVVPGDPVQVVIDGMGVWLHPDAPVHVHDEEAGRDCAGCPDGPDCHEEAP